MLWQLAGSSITRVLHETPDIQFVNDEEANEFIVTIIRQNSVGNSGDAPEPTNAHAPSDMTEDHNGQVDGKDDSKDG